MFAIEETLLKSILRFSAFLIFLFSFNMLAVAEIKELDGLWRALGKPDGDQWGYYFENDVFYYAQRFGNQWFYLCDDPYGQIESGDEENTFVSSDCNATIAINGEKIFVKFIVQNSELSGSIGIQAEKIYGIKPEKATKEQFEIKEKEAEKKHKQSKLKQWIMNLKKIFRF